MLANVMSPSTGPITWWITIYYLLPMNGYQLGCWDLYFDEGLMFKPC